MIVTKYNWEVDQKRKVLYNEYGLILRDGPAWYFRGSYFDRDWANILMRSPLGGCLSLQAMVGNVESCILSYTQVSRRKLYLRVFRIAVYTLFLVAVSVGILFVWARAIGY